MMYPNKLFEDLDWGELAIDGDEPKDIQGLGKMSQQAEML